MNGYVKRQIAMGTVITALVVLCLGVLAGVLSVEVWIGLLLALCVAVVWLDRWVTR